MSRDTKDPDATDTCAPAASGHDARENPDSVALVGEKSPGVQRIEIVSSQFRLIDRIFLFFGIFLIAYVYGLDGTIRYTYQVCCFQLSKT